VTSLSVDWEVLSLPAIAEEDADINLNDQFAYRRPVGDALHPERESLATLQELQRMMGPEVFAAQYQQRPVPTGGALITRDGLSYYDTPPPRHRQGRVLQSWDVAAKDGVENDFSVCTTWLRQDGHFYLLDLTRERFTFPRLRETALRLAEQFKPDEILIEDASVGVALAQELRHKGEAIVTLQPVHRDKLARLYVQQEKFAAKRVHFPRGAPFLRDLEDELLTFPQGRHDDQVDSLSQALAYEGPSYDSSLAWVGSPDDKLPYMAGMAMARASWRR
jgi:predicted phage terminase large subunit-like protein